MRQAVPARAMRPRRSVLAAEPQFTSEDLPLPEVPTTARKCVSARLSTMASTWFSRPKNKYSSSSPEGPQARKRVRPNNGELRMVHAAAWAPVSCCRNLAVAASAKPPNPSIRPGSSMSIRSCLSAVLGSDR